MQFRNSESRFGLIAIFLHWLIAALFLGMIALGLTMTALALTDPLTFPLYQLHKSVGVTIFALVALRLSWRASGRVPPLPETLPPLERLAAKLAHWGLYAILIAMPLTGWAIVSASPLGIPTVLYGLATLPHLDFIATHPDKAAIGSVASTLHAALAWGGLALVALHAAAALRHHFRLGDDVLRRMLPSKDHFLRGKEKTR